MRCARPLSVVLAVALAAGCASPPPKKTTRRPAEPTAPKTVPAPPTASKPAPGNRTPPETRPVATPQTAAAEVTPNASGTPQERYAEAVRLLKSGQLAAAEAIFSESSRQFPQATGPQTNLGIVLARTNRRGEATAAFARAVTLDPGNAVAHNWLGVIAREAGDLRKAEQAYQQALAADPAHAPAQLNLAILYDLYLKKPAEALAAYRRYDEMVGKKDLRTAAWIAELEARAAAAATAAVPPPAAKPAPVTPAQPATPANPAARKKGATS